MKLTYVGKSDYRSISSKDFPDREDGGEDWEVTWTPGTTMDVPDDVAEFLKVHHRQEFKVYEELVEEVEATEDFLGDAGEPELTREEHKVELETMTRDELVDLAENKELIVATSKTKKTELVNLLLDYYYPPDDEAIE